MDVIAHEAINDEVLHDDASSDNECDAQNALAPPSKFTVMNAFDAIRD